MPAANRHVLPLGYDISGAGTPVVFLPGLTFDRHTWQPIIERLGGRVRSVAIDLPGHGDSGDGPTAFGPLASVLRCELDALGIERPVVVGHSMSGGIALTYAAQHPVRAVVTVDDAPWLRPFAELLHQLGPSLLDERFQDVFLRVFQSTLGMDLLAPTVRALVLQHQRIRQDVVLAYWQEAMSIDPDTLQDRVDRATAAVDVPVLAVFGRDLGPEERKRLDRMPATQVEQWRGRGHFVHLAEPDRFAQRLLQFVDGSDTGTPPSTAS